MSYLTDFGVFVHFIVLGHFTNRGCSELHALFLFFLVVCHFKIKLNLVFVLNFLSFTLEFLVFNRCAGIANLLFVVTDFNDTRTSLSIYLFLMIFSLTFFFGGVTT
jgi:hypothetical protein